MKGFISGLSLVSVFLACPPPAVRATEAPAAPVQPGAASPSEALYQFSTAKLLAVEGSVPEALEAFEEAEGLAPAAFYIRVEHAQLLARAGEISRVPATRQDYLRRAAAKIEEARRLAPENLDVLRAAGSIYLDLSLVDPTAQATAITALEAVRRAAPSDVPASLSLGQLYLEHRQPAQAVQVLRDLISRVPQQRVAYALLIEALMRSERRREAEDALGEILAFDPASLESRLNLADLQAERGDHDSALATLRAGQRKQPSLSTALALAEGDLVFQRTRPDGSVRWVDWTAFNITPQYLGQPIVSNDDDTFSTSLGIGRRFNENWSGAVILGYEKTQGTPSGNLGPTDGYKSIGIAATNARSVGAST